MARGAPQTWGREARGGDRDGEIGRRQDVGRDYAIAAVEAMIADGRNVLGLIFSDMVRTAVERGAVRGKRAALNRGGRQPLPHPQFAALANRAKDSPRVIDPHFVGDAGFGQAHEFGERCTRSARAAGQ
jgi:hypothetical protein